MNLTSGQLSARDALRARQGAGARYDAPEAPAKDLLLARRATADFARILAEVEDGALSDPIEGDPARTRARLLAEIGYGARRMALALEPLCPVNTSLPAEALPDVLPSLDLAATLPAHALRHLFSHSAIHLDVCWRDLPGRHWEAKFTGADGAATAVRDLPGLRAESLRRGALLLGRA
ncbi:MAG: maleylpyruvate isomerase [Pseudomonadota bacterium]